VGIHLAREHPRELDLGDPLLDRDRVALDLGDAGLVALRLDEVEQLCRVVDDPGDAVQFGDYALEPRTFAPELLRLLRVVPYPGILELAVYLLEPLTLLVVLKGTPSAH
jgi:hypothetical protein